MTTRPARVVARAALIASLLLGALPAGAGAQVFIASHPNPGFTVGPLYIRASVTPELDVLPVDVFWSLVVPPGRSLADAVRGDLFLLWPGAVLPAPDLGPPDPALAKYVEEHGFTSIDEGRLELTARDASSTERTRQAIPGGAPYVTYVRQGGALGLTSPATYIRIPRHPKLLDPAWMTRVRMQTKGLVKPKAGTWAERAFWGPRYRLLLSFQDVNPRAIFPLYFENRDRVLRLAEDPAQIRIDFASADHLKIDEIAPPSVRRQLSETRDNTEVVTLFLDQSEGLRPQTLTVQFGYFSGFQSWALILIPLAFFTLGNLAAPILKEIGMSLARTARARIHVGSPDARRADPKLTVLGPDTLARIRPGQTTVAEVLRLCGPNDEEQERLDAPGRRTLMYHGRQLVPQRKRSWGWISTVSHWEMEQQDVEITVDGDIVSDVQARVRRARLARPE